jgi:hypothetical protein
MMLRSHRSLRLRTASRKAGQIVDTESHDAHHDMHHDTPRRFGLYFTWWDRLVGTEHPDYRIRTKLVRRSMKRAATSKAPMRLGWAKRFLSAASWRRRGTTMNFYERWILPPILDLTMRQKHLTKYRRAVVAAAVGVLEIGVGSGLNFPLMANWVSWSTGSILTQIAGNCPSACCIIRGAC